MDPDALLTLIDEGTLQTAQDRAGARFPVSPSSLASCPRMLARRLSGVPASPISPETQRVFDNGHQRGEMLAQALRRRLTDLGYTVQLEKGVFLDIPLDQDTLDLAIAKVARDWPTLLDQGVTVADGCLRIEGHADLVAWLPSRTGGIASPILIDFKTAGGYGFGKLDKEGPDDRYLAQVIAYRNGLAKAWKLNPSTITSYLVYECKDSDARKGLVAGNLRAEPVCLPGVEELEDRERDAENAYHQALTLATTAIEAWAHDKAELVPEPYQLKGSFLPWNCNYCSIGPVRGHCYGAVENTGTDLRPKWKLLQGALA